MNKKNGEDGGVSPRYALPRARFIHIHSFAQFDMYVRDISYLDGYVRF